jgi:hypothetical protein
MKVHILKHGRGPDDKLPGVFVKVSPVEALSLIRTLAQQLANEDPNSGRLEFVPREKGVSYFSMCIDFEGVETLAGVKREAQEQIDHWREMWREALLRVPVEAKDFLKLNAEEKKLARKSSIDAVRAYRSRTGAMLKEAADVVRAFKR